MLINQRDVWEKYALTVFSRVKASKVLTLDTEKVHKGKKSALILLGVYELHAIIIDLRKLGFEQAGSWRQAAPPGLEEAVEYSQGVVIGSGILNEDSEGRPEGGKRAWLDTQFLVRWLCTQPSFPWYNTKDIARAKGSLKHLPELVFGCHYGPLHVGGGGAGDKHLKTYAQPYKRWPREKTPQRMYDFATNLEGESNDAKAQLNYLYSDCNSAMFALFVYGWFTIKQGFRKDTDREELWDFLADAADHALGELAGGALEGDAARLGAAWASHARGTGEVPEGYPPEYQRRVSKQEGGEVILVHSESKAEDVGVGVSGQKGRKGPLLEHRKSEGQGEDLGGEGTGPLPALGLNSRQGSLLSQEAGRPQEVKAGQGGGDGKAEKRSIIGRGPGQFLLAGMEDDSDSPDECYSVKSTVHVVPPTRDIAKEQSYIYGQQLMTEEIAKGGVPKMNVNPLKRKYAKVWDRKEFPLYAQAQPKPRFMCSFCAGARRSGGRRRSKKKKQTSHNKKEECPIYLKLRRGERDREGRALGEDLCEYQECPCPQNHYTEACPYVVRICKGCDFRGHQESDCFRFEREEREEWFRAAIGKVTMVKVSGAPEKWKFDMRGEGPEYRVWAARGGTEDKNGIWIHEDEALWWQRASPEEREDFARKELFGAKPKV